MTAARTLAEAVLAEFQDGDSVLLDVSRKRYHRLNRTAAVIWKGLEEGDDDDAIVARLMAEFEVEQAEAGQALAAFLAELRGLGLVARPRERP